MNFFRFELRYWFRQPMVYVFFAINTLIIFGATYSDQVQVGGSIGNVYRNAPFVIQNFYAIMSYITLLMTTSFLLSSTIRDFSYNTHQIIFSTPVKRTQYLLGRFFGATFVAMLPLLGISLGIILASWMPDIDPDKIGPFAPGPHISSILQFAIPNTLFSASVVFMIAALTRNTLSAFIGSILLLLLTGIAGAFAEDLDKEWIAIIMDPYGFSTYGILTKYWTVHDKNTLVLPLQGLFLANRLIWIFISLVLISVTVRIFSFTEKTRKKKRRAEDSEPALTPVFKVHAPLPVHQPDFSTSSLRIMLFKHTKHELKGIFKSPTFIILLLAGLLNFLPNIIAHSGAYGLSTHPVTYDMIDAIQGSFYSFLVAIIIVYSGLLVWKERENRFDEIYDATPHPTWISYLSKFIALFVVIGVVQLLCTGVSMLVQLGKGFTDLRPDVYLKSLLVIDYSGLLFLVVMAMFIHTLVNNKYLAFFIFIVFLLLNNFLWAALKTESNMVQYGGRPSYTYSDMNGFGPFVSGIAWFRIYWGLAAIILATWSVAAWTRGKEFNLRHKFSLMAQSFRDRHALVLIPAVLVWICTAGFVYYNTQVLNRYDNESEREDKQVEYERSFKKYEHLTQPRITDLKYRIDLFPEERKALVEGGWWIQNKSHERIDSIHVTLPEQFKTELDIPGAKMAADYPDLHYRIYRLDRAMEPGDSLHVTFRSTFAARGFENEVRFDAIVNNGSFFNNTDFSPMIGYQPGFQLQDRDKRKKHGLNEIERMPKLERNCTAHCMNTYLDNHSDWVQVETEMITDTSQIAVAPGSLIRQWTSGSRNHYLYKLDHKALNFYSFISARYQVRRSQYKGVDVEVYYDAKHPYNIDNMEKSMKRSLDYYTRHFGPYYHRQVRIIEFPRYATFAQAFPGTMPYSEGIGFIAKIEDPDDIDMVFYVVAHEMAHQYWAHQLISADMQGATLLTETFAQYSALMVMEKEYGRDAMKKFLRYEMDRYLRSRGSERLKELPLMYVENQGYVHYRKGSLVMYYLREMIGEEAVNKALRSLLEKYGYQDPPYPTAYDAVDAFRANTPDSLQYIIHDLFETITIYNNRTTQAVAKKISNGKYEVTVDVEARKFRADSLGREAEIPVDDWIEVGVLGEPKPGRAMEPVIFRQKFHITRKENSFTLVVDSKPFKAGIDPMNLLVDQVGDDNVMKVEFPEDR